MYMYIRQSGQSIIMVPMVVDKVPSNGLTCIT